MQKVFTLGLTENRFYKLKAMDEAIREEAEAAIYFYMNNFAWPDDLSCQANEILRRRTRSVIIFAMQGRLKRSHFKL